MMKKQIEKKKQLTPEQAVELLLAEIKPLKETERIPVSSAGGRILAEDLIAIHSNPPFARSAMDGYAVRSEDVQYASPEHPVTLKVLGEVDAGDVSKLSVLSGTAIRIMTGAKIPEGCDCVLRQEQTDYGETEVQVYSGELAGGNCVPEGEDYRKGEVLLREGAFLTYIEQAIAAGMGYDCLKVYRRPRVAVITTGSELISPGQPLTESKIYDSNQTLTSARLLEWGAIPVMYPIQADEIACTASCLREACQQADLVITTGGVSVGKKDILHPVIDLMNARRLFWGLGIKPGMPTMASVYEGVPIVSLSGNPFAAAVVLELLIRPAICKLTGNQKLKRMEVQAFLADTYRRKTPVRRFLRARFSDGKLWLPEWLEAEAKQNQEVGQSQERTDNPKHRIHGNSVLASLTGCNCLIDIPAGTEFLPDGSPVSILLL